MKMLKEHNGVYRGNRMERVSVFVWEEYGREFSKSTRVWLTPQVGQVSLLYMYFCACDLNLFMFALEHPILYYPLKCGF